MTNPLHAILDQMDKRGGSFVCSLAATMWKADPENLAKLVNAFPEYMECYDGWASVEKRGDEQ